MYSSDERITSNEIIKFLKDLLNINKNKRIFIVWDNARIHTSKIVEEFIKLHEDEQSFIEDYMEKNNGSIK